jgi:TDG/mug DNA glycosylase family protein
VASDLLKPDLRLLFCGYNPSLVSGRTGSRFWRVLFAAGITERLYRPEEDARLLDLGIAFTKV